MFLKLGSHAGASAIHQPLYLSREATLEEAIHSQHEIILRHMRTSESNSVLDLGCGVGASLAYLAGQETVSVKFTGITLSESQATTGQQLIDSSGLSKRVEILQGSYLELPESISSVQLAFAIESFIHTPDPNAFFNEVTRVLEPGALLIIFDDFLTRPPESAEERRIIRDFEQGWKANTLLSSDVMKSTAQQSGLQCISGMDHTASLKYWRLRDKLVSLSIPIVRTLSSYSNYCTFLVGGDARQQALRKGLIGYREFVFKKQESISHE